MLGRRDLFQTAAAAAIAGTKVLNEFVTTAAKQGLLSGAELGASVPQVAEYFLEQAAGAATVAVPTPRGLTAWDPILRKAYQLFYEHLSQEAQLDEMARARYLDPDIEACGSWSNVFKAHLQRERNKAKMISRAAIQEKLYG